MCGGMHAGLHVEVGLGKGGWKIYLGRIAPWWYSALQR